MLDFKSDFRSVFEPHHSAFYCEILTDHNIARLGLAFGGSSIGEEILKEINFNFNLIQIRLLL